MSDGEDAGLDAPDWVTREQATHRLRAGPDSAAVTRLLLRALRDPELEVRKAAVEALGHRRATPRRLEAVVGALGDPEWEVRWAAVRALERLGSRSPDVERALRHATGDADPAVAGAARLALAGAEPGPSR